MTAVKKCDGPQGSVTGVRKLFQMMERCDCHGRDVRVCEDV